MPKGHRTPHRSYRNPGNTPNNSRKPNYKPQKTGKGKKLGILEIARRTGISGAHISKIFSGKRGPSFATAARISAVLDISIDVLYLRLAEAREAHAYEEARKKRVEEARVRGVIG